MTDAVRTGRRPSVVAVTLLIGVVALPLTLRLEPGNAFFLGAAFGLAAVWGGGAWLAGTRFAVSRERAPQLLALGAAVGGSLLAACLLAGLVAGRLPVLREPAQHLLGHAGQGPTLLLIVLTVVNGVAEEMFFRGALYDTLPPRSAVITTTLVYTLMTVGSGVALLVVAAAFLGGATAWLRRRTSGLLAPTVAHLTWSVGMLLLLPSVLATGR